LPSTNLQDSIAGKSVLVDWGETQFVLTRRSFSGGARCGSKGNPGQVDDLKGDKTSLATVARPQPFCFQWDTANRQLIMPRDGFVWPRNGFDWVRFGSFFRAFPFVFNDLVASFSRF
jgi:hypothetical protein